MKSAHRRSTPTRRALRHVAGALLVTLAAAGTASATGYPIGGKTPVDPSFSCRDFDTAGLLSELTINPLPDGPAYRSDGTLGVVTVHYESTEGWVLDWYQDPATFAQSIHHVLVSGDNGSFAYSYDPPVTEDRNLSGAGATALMTFTTPKFEPLDKATFCYSTPRPGVEGCTLGYWKVPQHHDSWPWPYTTLSGLQATFGANAFNETFLAALNYKGGAGVDGGKRILLKQAVASLLNSASGGVEFPLTTAEVIGMTTFALNSGDRDVMLSLAATLDAYNNQGCPLN